MNKYDLKDFYIENLQPVWLQDKSLLNNYLRNLRLTHEVAIVVGIALFVGPLVGLPYGQAKGLAAGLAVGLISGSVVGLTIGLVFWQVVRLAGGVAGGLVVGRVGGLSRRQAFKQISLELYYYYIYYIHIIDKTSWSLHTLRSAMRELWVIEAALMLASGLLIGLFEGIAYGWDRGFATGLTVGLGYGAIFLFRSGFTVEPVVNRLEFNQGIWNSGKNSIKNLCVVSVIFGLLVWLTVGLVKGLTIGLVFGLVTELMPQRGLFIVIQHVTLREMLRRQGYIPRNYARFLQYASYPLRYMVPVGGGFKFMHGLLQDYFASLTDEDIERLSQTP